MSDFHFHDVDDAVWLDFHTENGWMELLDAGERITVTIPRAEAINLASKLLQWGTS